MVNRRTGINRTWVIRVAGFIRVNSINRVYRTNRARIIRVAGFIRVTDNDRVYRTNRAWIIRTSRRIRCTIIRLAARIATATLTALRARTWRETLIALTPLLALVVSIDVDGFSDLDDSIDRVTGIDV